MQSVRKITFVVDGFDCGGRRSTSDSGIVNNAGTLLINGQFGNVVELGPNPANVALTSWRGIEFGPVAITSQSTEAQDCNPYNAVFNGVGSVIQNCKISKAGSSSTAALNFGEGRVPYLLNVELSGCLAPTLTGIINVNKLRKR